MNIDLHIHTKTGSDGEYIVPEIFRESLRRNIKFLSITDHDSIAGQLEAIKLAKVHGIRYISGVELNVTFTYYEPITAPKKTVTLDFLGYAFDIEAQQLINKLQYIQHHREERGKKILAKLNMELEKEGLIQLTEKDLSALRAAVNGTFGRPHIANYLVKKGIVKSVREAFEKYLVKCDVPKYPLYLKDASNLIHDAGGILVFAHPNDPQGTSLIKLTRSLQEQTAIIETEILEYIDGIECWHSRHDPATTRHYIEFSKKHNLIQTGGSDCHQRPVIMGTVKIPDYVTTQF
jgi:hypothetical protein